MAERSRSPLIGLTCGVEGGELGRYGGRMKLNYDYVRAVEIAGGCPVAIPPYGRQEVLERLLEELDGLVLPGGEDVDPSLFGQEPRPGLGAVEPERDRLEIAAARLALERGLPVLGICRGIQVLNVAAGGSLYQDLPSQCKSEIGHYQKAPRWYPSHEVQIEEGSLLHRILGAGRLRVNSFHHQAVWAIAPGFRVCAKAADGVIEAIESRQARFALGVQWHPECMVESYPVQRRLFEALVEEARSRATGRKDAAQARAAG